jgi:hypothetical protein
LAPSVNAVRHRSERARVVTATIAVKAIARRWPAAASSGPAANCSVDKIDEFVAELRAPATSASEKLLALKFLMHFVGDLHQPLHSADNDDAGGNAEQVTAADLGSGTLHGFWDTQFVQRLGSDPIAIGDELAAKITAAHVTQWSTGTATDWAQVSFGIAKTEVYANLPKPARRDCTRCLLRTSPPRGRIGVRRPVS